MPVPARRVALIQAALRVISREGVAAATTRAIAAEAGMSLASLHYAFESRDELIAYVVQEQTYAALETIQPGTDLVSTIRNALRAFLDVVAADPQRELAMFELTQYALRTPGMADAAQRQYDGYHAAAAQVVAAVGELTGHRWARPIDEMARILVTLTDGLTLRWLVDRDTDAAAPVIDFAAHALAALALPAK
jgi:AcrR family transcriptional regulator